jgi:hypothetical protein
MQRREESTARASPCVVGFHRPPYGRKVPALSLGEYAIAFLDSKRGFFAQADKQLPEWFAASIRLNLLKLSQSGWAGVRGARAQRGTLFYYGAAFGRRRRFFPFQNATLMRRLTGTAQVGDCDEDFSGCICSRSKEGGLQAWRKSLRTRSFRFLRR